MPEFTGEYHLRLWAELLGDRSPLPPQPFVYVIQGDPGGPVKVGHAQNVLGRVAELQTGNPERLNLLFVLPGSTGLERSLQARASDDRVLGEWFTGSATDDLLGFVAGLALWMVDGYRTSGRIPDWRGYGQWERLDRRSGESPLHRDLSAGSAPPPSR